MKYRYTYNKLVRDKIPKIIDGEPGRKGTYRILNDEEKRNIEEEKELNKGFRK